MGCKHSNTMKSMPRGEFHSSATIPSDTMSVSSISQLSKGFETLDQVKSVQDLKCYKQLLSGINSQAQHGLKMMYNVIQDAIARSFLNTKLLELAQIYHSGMLHVNYSNQQDPDYREQIWQEGLKIKDEATSVAHTINTPYCSEICDLECQFQIFCFINEMKIQNDQVLKFIKNLPKSNEPRIAAYKCILATVLSVQGQQKELVESLLLEGFPIISENISDFIIEWVCVMIWGYYSVIKNSTLSKIAIKNVSVVQDEAYNISHLNPTSKRWQIGLFVYYNGEKLNELLQQAIGKAEDILLKSDLVVSKKGRNL